MSASGSRCKSTMELKNGFDSQAKNATFMIRNQLQKLLFMRQGAPAGERARIDDEVVQLRLLLQRTS